MPMSVKPNQESFLFTSESVTEGHPDKMADQISDAILDAVYAEDPEGRVACETSVSTGHVLLFGEITTDAHINYNKIVRETIADIGYTHSELDSTRKPAASWWPWMNSPRILPWAWTKAERGIRG